MDSKAEKFDSTNEEAVEAFGHRINIAAAAISEALGIVRNLAASAVGGDTFGEIGGAMALLEKAGAIVDGLAFSLTSSNDYVHIGDFDCWAELKTTADEPADA